MKKYNLSLFVCLINIISFGQKNADGEDLWQIGNYRVPAEFPNSHVITPFQKSDVEKLGLKGCVTSVQFQILDVIHGDEHGAYDFEIYRELINFDKKGNRVFYQKKDAAGEILNYQYVHNDRGIIEKALITGLCMEDSIGVEYYKYDSLGNVLLELRQDLDGYVTAFTKRIFDDSGELIEEKIADMGGITWSDDFLVLWQKYERSSKGMKIKDFIKGEVWWGEKEEFDEILRFINRKRFKSKEYIYSYDAEGNWVQRTTLLNGTIIQKEIRQIEYYSEIQNENEKLCKKIGNQIWMSKNLDVKTFNNGDAIMQAQCEEEWEKAFLNKTPAWCNCEDLEGNLTKDVLYNYYSLIDPRGLAPAGYLIATLEDWNILFNEYGGLEGAFEKLKDHNHDDLNTASIHGYRRGNWLLPESYWWTKDEKKICLAVDNIGKMLIFEYQGEGSYYHDGLLLRCVKE